MRRRRPRPGYTGSAAQRGEGELIRQRRPDQHTAPGRAGTVPPQPRRAAAAPGTWSVSGA